MGPLDRIRTKRPLHLLLSMLFLLSSNPIKHSVEGRSLPALLEVASGRGEAKAAVRALVGSRPPVCERRCIACGHCEAVQVPVIPQETKSRSRQFLGTAAVRGDYSSNYKPLSWKCKCGDLIFDP